MKAKVDKSFDVNHPVNVVWEYLKDPSKIVSCVPGAELTEKIDDQNYKGKVSLKFGPVAAKYNGQINIEKEDADNYELFLKGKGTDSRGKGGANMELTGKLEDKGDNITGVNYSMVISVTGMLAQFGSRLIVDVTDHLTNQFIENFKAKLDEENPRAVEVPARRIDGDDDLSAVEVPARRNIDDGDDLSAVEVPARRSIGDDGDTGAVEVPARKADNSVNAFGLLWSVMVNAIKRLFKRS